MESFDTAKQLAAAGRFVDALAALDLAVVKRADRPAAETLRADLLERTGKHGQSRALAQQLLKSKDLSPSDRSRCESILGMIDAEDGNVDSAYLHLQRALAIAKQERNVELACWARLRLLSVIADRSSPEATTPLIAELRSDAVKLGNRKVLGALHIFIGQMEAKRGLFRSAVRHTRIGMETLSIEPDLGLEAMAQTTLLSAAMLRSEFAIALGHARRGVHVAQQSGAAVWRRASFANMAHLFYLLGRFDESVDYYDQALSALPSAGDNGVASLGSLAELRLAQGRIDESAELLDRMEQSIREPKDRMAYPHRHTAPTRSRLLARQGDLCGALENIESALVSAEVLGDQLLRKSALLTKAELLDESHASFALAATLDGAIADLNYYPDLHAHYERVLACALAADGDAYAAHTHFDRAKRIYGSLGHVPGLLELNRRWDRATSQAATRATPSTTGGVHPADEPAAHARTAVQAAAALMLHAGHPELLAREIVELLGVTGCVRGATAISRDADGQIETLAVSGEPPAPDAPPQAAKRIAIGTARERAVEVLAAPRPDIESVATLNAVTLLLSTIHDLECARAEREERLALWPIDDVPLDDGGQAVVAGQMRELMSFARRIAHTNVSVLITGESGTGKEILARAIHAFSQRAQKPFAPFNCAAVPRELLESQLFGHRRGSFTGADRDHPGLIQSARGGTLFLDEIGELGLDLQPKLLRFLESGEISPLGEPTPFTVDVRVIAATNSNLEQLVKEGRFREDLFYRLNVIRLPIPPLRERRDEIHGLVNYFVGRATQEFDKGQVRLAEETMEYLLLYPWPGNVRQLNNELRRMVALAERDTVLTPSHLSEAILREQPVLARPVNGSEIAVPLHDKLGPTLSKIEREMIKAALREHHGKVDAVAHALGISRKGLYLKRQRLGL
jgi:DNA-binding NtrC family response regulator/tetratricopeptide (TPR) repeat protein